MRIGVFGGTFDPIHNGHLAAAQEVLYTLDLSRVIFVPAYHQPLKEHAPQATDAERLDMLRLAIAGNERFSVDMQELDRPAPSYTIDTVRSYANRGKPDDELYFLVGVDAVNALGRWREPAELVRLARLAVMSRSAVRQPDWTALEAVAPDIRERVDVVVVPNIDISSRELRQRAAAGQPIRYQVPDAVYQYIEERRLYRG